MRHVWIVAGILDHAGGRRPVALPIDGKREGGALAAGKRDLYGIGELAGREAR